LVERRLTGNDFHQYLQPDREIDAGAVEVHGITNEFLQDKPRFEDVVQDFMDYIQGAELIIHNAPFDVGFLDAELIKVGGWNRLDSYCRITDTLVMARSKHPGQRNSLDALCGRYDIDNSQRQKHGALLDAEILAEVYLAMTGGQSVLFQEEQGTEQGSGEGQAIRRLSPDRPALAVVKASPKERAAHEKFLEKLGDSCFWTRA
jgi:DNA polymerase-3 subunit epsilon